ncbi:MAG: hypothetical protein QM487_14255 [Candidatus Marithrix sp.]
MSKKTKKLKIHQYLVGGTITLDLAFQINCSKKSYKECDDVPQELLMEGAKQIILEKGTIDFENVTISPIVRPDTEIKFNRVKRITPDRNISKK